MDRQINGKVMFMKFCIKLPQHNKLLESFFCLFCVPLLAKGLTQLPTNNAYRGFFLGRPLRRSPSSDVYYSTISLIKKRIVLQIPKHKKKMLQPKIFKSSQTKLCTYLSSFIQSQIQNLNKFTKSCNTELKLANDMQRYQSLRTSTIQKRVPKSF